MDKIEFGVNDYLHYIYASKLDDDTVVKKIKQIQNQKAIEVLEKVIDFIKNADKRPEYWDISQFITNQLKLLKENK